MRVPITGQAQRVSDTVQRAMDILKDRKDPAMKPETPASGAQGAQTGSDPARSRRSR